MKSNKLLLVSYDKEAKNHNIYAFIYDVKSDKLHRLDLNPIISITDVKYDYDSNTAYFAGWLKEDEDKIIKEKEGYNIPLQRYIYSYQFDQSKLNLIYKGESQFDSFGIDFKNKLIYIKNNNQKLIKFDINKKENLLTSIDAKSLVHIEGDTYYYIHKNLLNLTKDKLTNISNIKANLEAVNNAIFIKQ